MPPLLYLLPKFSKWICFAKQQKKKAAAKARKEAREQKEADEALREIEEQQEADNALKEVEAQVVAASCVKMMITHHEVLWTVSPDILAKVRFLTEQSGGGKRGSSAGVARVGLR